MAAIEEMDTALLEISIKIFINPRFPLFHATSTGMSLDYHSIRSIYRIVTHSVAAFVSNRKRNRIHFRTF